MRCIHGRYSVATETFVKQITQINYRIILFSIVGRRVNPFTGFWSAQFNNSCKINGKCLDNNTICMADRWRFKFCLVIAGGEGGLWPLAESGVWTWGKHTRLGTLWMNSHMKPTQALFIQSVYLTLHKVHIWLSSRLLLKPPKVFGYNSEWAKIGFHGPRPFAVGFFCALKESAQPKSNVVNPFGCYALLGRFLPSHSIQQRLDRNTKVHTTT